MTTVFIRFKEDGKILEHTYSYVISVSQNKTFTVIEHKEDSEIYTATFKTDSVLTLNID